MIKAVLLDFDGTLVTKDILDVVCGIVGKEEESDRINKEYFSGKRTGIQPLIERINFLKGVSLAQIQKKLDENAYLMPGAQELLAFLNQNSIISILHSGNIMPILQYYQRKLDITHIVGTNPRMKGGTIEGISEEDFEGKDFKLQGCKKILAHLSISPEETLAIGDSPADKQVFEYAGVAIAINPKENIEAYADYVIKNDLREVIEIIESKISHF